MVFFPVSCPGDDCFVYATKHTYAFTGLAEYQLAVFFTHVTDIQANPPPSILEMSLLVGCKDAVLNTRRKCMSYHWTIGCEMLLHPNRRFPQTHFCVRSGYTTDCPNAIIWMMSQGQKGYKNSAGL